MSFDPIPRPPEGWWQQVPLLRELYQLLSSNEPVNWDLARQVAVALASENTQPGASSEEIRRELEDMSRAAEVQLEELTGMVASDVAPVVGADRAQWVSSNIEALKFLLEPLAAKLAAGALPVALPAQATDMIGRILAIPLGLQAGMVLGYLSQTVLGQYELTLPQPSGAKLLYVVPNLVTFERDWHLDSRDFRYWIALHEVVHHLELSRPWARRWFHSQLRTLVESMDFDPERLQEVFGAMDITDPEHLSQALESPETLIQAAWTPLGRDTAGRLEAFLSLIEGYATWAMDAVGARVLTDHPRLREAMDRRKRTRSAGEELLERLLGLELKQRQYEEGVRFCRYIVGTHDIATLNLAWDSPESVPTLAEIANPDSWIERVSGGTDVPEDLRPE